MPPFRLVDGAQAGPTALGILVPPSRLTVIVARPRSLDLDLLLLRRGLRGELADSFHETGRSEAASLAKNLCKALEEGTGRVDVVPGRAGGFWVRAEVGPFALLACPRSPGQAYRPRQFDTEADAQQVAAALTAILCPGADAEQELYVNTQHFSR